MGFLHGAFAMMLRVVGAKNKTHISFCSNNIPHIICEPCEEMRIFKKWREVLLRAALPSRHLRFFYLFAKDYFVSFSRFGNHRATTKKDTKWRLHSDLKSLSFCCYVMRRAMSQLSDGKHREKFSTISDGFFLNDNELNERNFVRFVLDEKRFGRESIGGGWKAFWKNFKWKFRIQNFISAW